MIDGKGKGIDLHHLPLADLVSYLEMNPPRLPYNSLAGRPSIGNAPFSVLNEFVVGPSAVTGFSMSIEPKLDLKNYAGLMIECSVRCTGAAVASMLLQFNTDTSPLGTNYDFYSAGMNTGQAAITVAGVDPSTGVWPSPVTIHIPDFLNASVGKSLTSTWARHGTATAAVIGGWWSQTQAIQELVFSLGTAGVNFEVGSRFTAYALGAQ